MANWRNGQLRTTRYETADRLNYVRTHIESIIPRSHFETVRNVALQRIVSAAEHTNRTLGLAYSAGKDSIVVHHLLDQTALPYRALLIVPDISLEWAFMPQWRKTYGPATLDTVRNTKLTLELYRKEWREWLFVHSVDHEMKWNTKKWNLQHKWARENDVEVYFMGRRKKDGNYCGKDGISTRKSGTLTVNPIYDWTNEEFLAYLHYADVTLPPSYFWDNRFNINICTQRWVDIDYGTEYDNWKFIGDHDPATLTNVVQTGWFPEAERAYTNLEVNL